MQELEVMLGLPDDIKDSELVDAQKSIESALDKARGSVKK